MSSPGSPFPATPGRAIDVSYELPGGKPATVRFTRSFTIGRDPTNRIVLQEPGVSRRHACVEREAGRWVIRDLDSRNGTLLNGKAIGRYPVTSAVTVQIGTGGPCLRLEVEGAMDVSRDETVLAPLKSLPASEPANHVYDRYLQDEQPQDAGAHTTLVRNVIASVRRRDRRRYGLALGLIGCLFLAALGIVIYQELRLSEINSLAVDIFYDMKQAEIKIANLEEKAQLDEIAQERMRLRQMQARYERLAQESSVSTAGMSPEDQLILRIARVFGECELNVPRDFAAEVKRYIKRWQSSKRLPRALMRMQRNGYGPVIRELLEANRLPVQFAYVALQESNYNVRAVGPSTRFGFAKGMWQFIPSTASDYGLHVGERTDEPQYDPEDERFDFHRSTHAAARYLRDIYKGEAQASGLLVLASYNWGHNRVRKRIEAMPENPRERNFWQLLKHFKIPEETYDYVFMIFSAAVIAEDPQRFGFDFSSPFEHEQRAAAFRFDLCSSASAPCYL